jgi:thiosulfate dehydrogenase (quinone) large subunit
MQTIWLSGAEWFAVLRIGLGLWWLESWRHKDKKGWFERGTGIAWAADVAGKHRWVAVGKGFETVVAPRPKLKILPQIPSRCTGMIGTSRPFTIFS